MTLLNHAFGRSARAVAAAALLGGAAVAADPPAKKPSTAPAASRPAGPREVPTVANQTYAHPASGARFPFNAGAFRRAKVFAVDAEARNVAVGYADPALKIALTVFVYPAHGVPAADHMKQVNGDVTRMYPKAKLLDESPASARPGGRAVEGTRARYSFVGPLAGVEQDVVSEAWLFAHGGQFVKVRLTYPAADRKAAEPRVRTFLDALTFPAGPATKPVAD